MTTLLLIDVQNDFHPGGSLGIPSAKDDAHRIAAYVREHASSIDRIVATLDSHHKLHIAHPCFWTDRDGNHPNLFTLISAEDVSTGNWIPRSDLKHPPVDDEVLATGGEIRASIRKKGGELDLVQYCVEYCTRLEEKGRFQLCIWPEHCLVGTPGHNIVEDVRAAIDEWSDATGGSVECIQKGENLLTENYSALCAEVPICSKTSFNKDFFDSLRKSERILVAGQALSHCVNYTVRDLVEHWPAEELNKITLLTDGASPVPGFEEAGETFLKDMKDAGINLKLISEIE